MAAPSPCGGGVVTVLSDLSIRMAIDAEHLWIESLDENAIQPASVDLRLGDTLLWWPHWVRRDPRIDQSHVWKHWVMENPHEEPGPIWVIVPGIRYLAVTRE